MVPQEITLKTIESVCKSMKYYDLHKRLPDRRVRIDITISKEALEKIKEKNRSRFINNLILNS